MRILFLVLVLIALLASAQVSETTAPDYTQLIRQSAQAEATALKQTDLLRFQERVEEMKVVETRDVVECVDGRFDRVIAYNDRPLVADQQRKEDRRLQQLLNDGDARSTAQDDWQAEKRRRIKMVLAMPDAFLFSDPVQEPSGELRFTFAPARGYSPRDRETKVYRGMEGTLWLDPRAGRITRVEGHLVKNVDFGWGIFGRLYKGGSFAIEQREILPGIWRITRMDLDFKGRVFLFSGLRIYRRESSSDFKALEHAIGYSEAINLLLH